MYKISFPLILLLTLFFSACTYQLVNNQIDIKQAIRTTDVERNSMPDTAVINLYQGNGVFGSSYGPLGLHLNPAKGADFYKYGKTEYLCLNHLIRAKYGADYLIPLAQIFWKDEPANVTNYSQHQSFYDGTISTHFESDENKVTVLTWFDPVNKNLSGIKIDLEGETSDVVLKPSELLNVHYGQTIDQTCVISEDDGQWKIELSCMNAKSEVFIKTNAEVKLQDSELILKLHPGENNIQLSLNKLVDRSSFKSLTQNKEWWHSKWENMGMIVVPDLNAQRMWVRSMALFLSSYSDDKLGLSPPMGFTGNHWPFGYPQDVSYVHPMFLSTGNLNIAKSWIEYFAERLSGMKEYTKRLMKVDGIMCPWVFPYGDFTGYHTPEAPNKFYYEIHNSGYLARMAYETSVYVNDEDWTEKYAKPLIRETAQFYKSISKKGEDNLWHLSIKPSTGQDERGGVDQDDYLCALFSAKYCFQKAIEYQLDDDGTYTKMLNDGLAFPELKSERGYYYTSKGSGEADFGKQKHPVQLNDLAFLPVNEDVADASAIAYQLRYDITQDAKRPYFYGWTLGEFLLAGSRIGSVEGWQKDWENLRKADYVDPDWIQIYETSGVYRDAYYNITNGLVTQSLLNNLVCDWYGKLEIAKCNPWKGKIYLKNIYSKLGVKISGVIDGDSASLLLEAWKDCEFELRGERIRLKKNEQIERNLESRAAVE
ncbi:hypothetical protein ACUNWD_01190 [Sunxiuqinia sp. A32]|uniref:hypothetical protein n=1 Tax=Sunxiuqinia sp. A32 TaxID=3461496 RepID=UPI00404532F3